MYQLLTFMDQLLTVMYRLLTSMDQLLTFMYQLSTGAGSEEDLRLRRNEAAEANHVDLEEAGRLSVSSQAMFPARD